MNDDIKQVIAYAVATHCYEAVLVYPDHLDKDKQLNTRVGNIRVRSLTFSLDGNLENAGQSFVKELFPNSARDLFNC